MDYPAFTSSFSNADDKCCNRSINYQQTTTKYQFVKRYLHFIDRAQIIILIIFHGFLQSFFGKLFFLSYVLFIFFSLVKMGCTFSQQNLHASLKRIKRDNILHVASLNYCGILKSPFQFYSGQFHEALQKMSLTFEKLKGRYVSIPATEAFSWQFSKLDKKVKEKRYCPLYNLQAGIVDNKFISKKKFTELWKAAMDKVEKEEKIQSVPAESQEALKFDMLAYHTMLHYVYSVEDIDLMENKDPKLYLDTFKPFFDQTFLDEEKKILKFVEGLERTQCDVIFIQEGDEKLRARLAANPDYLVEVSPDHDTMICIKKSKFSTITPMRFNRLFGEGQFELLDWNNHSTVLIADKIILISGHLSSNKKINAENIETLKKGLIMLRQKHKDYDVICGGDLNSFLKQFNEELHVYPNEQKLCTCLKKRTSMQTQSNKAEVLSKESKDAIITTLPVLAGQISTIGLTEINETTYLPDDSHPFDHFLVFAQIKVEKAEPVNKVAV